MTNRLNWEKSAERFSMQVSAESRRLILGADTRDRRTMRAVTSDLVKRGFTRSVFITNKSATSSIKKKR
jgi:hypothetical protein